MSTENKTQKELKELKEQLFNIPIGKVLNSDFCNTFDCYENCERCWKKILNS